MLALLTSQCLAQRGTADRTWRLTLDNDLIAVRGAGPPPDYDYTHGTLLSLSTAAAPAFARRARGHPSCDATAAPRRACLSTTLALTQEIYTPRRDSTAPVVGERPYAGYLYASAIVHDVAGERTRSARLDVGVTGRISLAEAAQNGIHRALGNRRQLGWDHQFPGRAAVAVHLEEDRHAFTVAHHARLSLDGYGRASVGNLRSEVRTGIIAEIGSSRSDRWRPDIAPRAHTLGWYGLVGVEQQVVAADALITGSRTTGRAALKHFVGAGQGGLGYQGRRFAIEYREVARTREYAAQPNAHAFGSLTVRVFDQ